MKYNIFFATNKFTLFKLEIRRYLDVVSLEPADGDGVIIVAPADGDGVVIVAPQLWADGNP